MPLIVSGPARLKISSIAGGPANPFVPAALRCAQLARPSAASPRPARPAADRRPVLGPPARPAVLLRYAAGSRFDFLVQPRRGAVVDHPLGRGAASNTASGTTPGRTSRAAGNRPSPRRSFPCRAYRRPSSRTCSAASLSITPWTRRVYPAGSFAGSIGSNWGGSAAAGAGGFCRLRHLLLPARPAVLCPTYPARRTQFRRRCRSFSGPAVRGTIGWLGLRTRHLRVVVRLWDDAGVGVLGGRRGFAAALAGRLALPWRPVGSSGVAGVCRRPRRLVAMPPEAVPPFRNESRSLLIVAVLVDRRARRHRVARYRAGRYRSA